MLLLLLFGERLQLPDLRVQRAEVLLDDVGELCDLDGAVVEEGLALGELREALELRRRARDAAPDLGGLAGELGALLPPRDRVGGGGGGG